MPAPKAVSNGCNAASEVPPEVLEVIFFWVVQAELQDPSCSHPRSFAQVSGFWRATSIASPRLWGQIPPIVAGWDDSPSKWSKTIECIRLFLQRSKSQLLSFSLTSHHIYKASTLPWTSMQLVLSTLLEDSHRWGSVSLDFHADFLPIFSDIRGKIPKLHTLRFAIKGEEDPFNITYFDNAPALRHVTTHCRDYRDLIRQRQKKWSFTLPWSQLETYTEDSSYSMGFSHVISNSSTDLTSIRLTTSRFKPESIQKFAKHDKLTHLFIDNNDPIPTMGFFARDLDLPSLTDLHIAYRTSIVAPSLEDVTSLIIRSGCSLQRLSLLGLVNQS